MKVYITKYALTKGIIEIEEGKNGISRVKIDNDSASFFDNGYHKFYWRKDCHLTKTEAYIRAEELRKNKIASLKKQIGKLEKMTF